MKKNLELFISFFKIGLFTIGGGLAMLPMLTREIVEHRKWATDEELLNYYAIGQCTPGVIAVNTATFIGYSENGLIGAVFSTLGMVSPSLIIITIIASLLVKYMTLPIVAHALSGIRIMVCALLFSTVIRLVKSGVKTKKACLIFALGIVLAFFLKVPTIAIVLLAAIIGIILQVWEVHKK